MAILSSEFTKPISAEEKHPLFDSGWATIMSASDSTNIVNQEFHFSRVVFFGRALEEYINMFDLPLQELKGLRCLDCCAGPSSFAYEAFCKNISVVACDPLYDNNVDELRQLVDTHAEAVRARQAETMDLFYSQVNPVSRRRKAMEVFLNDFVEGKKAGRYVAGSLPNLPFESDSFDITLSANLLFLYSDIKSGGMLEASPFDYEFHRASIFELMRVTKKELRIYPLQGPKSSGHKYLEPIMQECAAAGFEAQVLPVAQRDIIGTETMLRVVRQSEKPS